MFENLLNLQIQLMLFGGIRYLKPIWKRKKTTTFLYYFSLSFAAHYSGIFFPHLTLLKVFVASLLLRNTYIKVYLKLLYIVSALFIFAIETLIMSY